MGNMKGWWLVREHNVVTEGLCLWFSKGPGAQQASPLLHPPCGPESLQSGTIDWLSR